MIQLYVVTCKHNTWRRKPELTAKVRSLQTGRKTENDDTGNNQGRVFNLEEGFIYLVARRFSLPGPVLPVPYSSSDYRRVTLTAPARTPVTPVWSPLEPPQSRSFLHPPPVSFPLTASPLSLHPYILPQSPLLQPTPVSFSLSFLPCNLPPVSLPLTSPSPVSPPSLSGA